MKKLLLFTLLFTSFLVLSQNPLLFNKNWKVEKANVDGNEVDVYNDPRGYSMNFSLDGFFYNYYSVVCWENYGKATFSTSSDDFIITEAHTSSSECLPDGFNSIYSFFFTKNSNDVNKITYNIEEISTGYKLTLTNISGDRLFYSYYTPPTALTSKVWYLSSLDFGNYHYNSPDPNRGHTTFSQNGLLQTSYIDAGQAALSFYNDDKFFFSDLAILDGPWDDPYIYQFNNAYFNGFLIGNSLLYSYEIASDEKKLTITKYNGDFATYYDSKMTVSETEKTKYKVYPNPASNIVTIENLKPESALEIIDGSGKTVKKLTNDKSSKTEINIKNLSSGIYYLKINNQSVQKIIKK